MNCTRGLFMVRSIVLRVFDPTLESKGTLFDSANIQIKNIAKTRWKLPKVK